MKELVKKIKKYCINSHRLEHDKREQLGLEYLMDYRGASGYQTQLELIKEVLFCMNKNHYNYQRLHLTKKKLVEKLIENEEVVDIVMCTLFQWFGTIVGSSDIKKLLDEIDSIDHTGKKEPYCL